MNDVRERFWAVLLAAVFALGPATGAERALHLAEAPHHDSDSCPVCQDLTTGSHAPQVPAPVVAVWSDSPPVQIRPVSDHTPVVLASPEVLNPRAPPA